MILAVRDSSSELMRMFGVPAEYHNPVFNISLGFGAFVVVRKLFSALRKNFHTSILESTVSFTLGKLNMLVESNVFPDWLLRIGIRALLASRLDSLPTKDVETQ
jgi:hypothetical protein